MSGHNSDEEAKIAAKLYDDEKHTEGTTGPLVYAKRPLIDQISNRWQASETSWRDDKNIAGQYSIEDEDHCPDLGRKTVKSRGLQKMLSYLALAIALGLWIWTWFFRPEMEMREGFLAKNDTHGIAKAGHFDGTRLKDLDLRYLPGGEYDPEGKKRLVFVGDIHGCAKELKKLLEKVEFDEENDHLVAVGDVISKGPDNIGVLDELIRLGASSPRGNHEDRILAIAPSVFDAGNAPEFGIESKAARKDVKLLRKLHKRHLRYLEDMPLMLRIPALPQATKASHKSSSAIAEEIIVVHAGLVPAIALEKQDPYFVMNMRAIHTKSHLPLTEAKAKHGKSKPWHDIWDWYNDRLFRKKSVKDFRIWDELEDVPLSGWDSWLATLGLKKRKHWPQPQVVVYGHHSKAGLQLDRWSKGLDTGCVSGGNLTAMVVDATGRWSTTSVGCKDYR